MLLWPPLTGTNSDPWLLEVGFFPAATPRATVTTGGLNQARVSGVVCASTSDNPRSNRPERRTALVARELARYKVDIAALNETRFSEQGKLEEVGADYTFFGSGRIKAKRRDAGVAFTIRNDIVGRLPCLPQGINDHLMSLHLPLRGDKFATIISTYAPPMTSSDAAKDKFYEDLHAMLVDAYRAEQPEIRIAYRTDGHLLNSCRMQASTHVSTTTVHGLLFANDCALNTVTEEDTQRSMDLFAAGCANFGLTISTAKTDVPKIELKRFQCKLASSLEAHGSALVDELASHDS
ncbi:unnamed protein product [Schistocephalus solidus]|uniref:Endo/exonuclease/phosphatase domain-containing protein n=1 Tax=Schistocephalus solidus TaxID=70667 RepID=A0A183TGJ5_SCHSO|nr:unnamed protein product [Schistocephalus solidus]